MCIRDSLPTVESEKQYVASVKDTILLRDIVKRKPVRDVRLLDDIFIYLVNNASNLFSVQHIVNFFKSKNRKVKMCIRDSLFHSHLYVYAFSIFIHLHQRFVAVVGQCLELS